LYPNPTANLLNIKTETEGKFDLTIVDLTGRKVLNKTNLNGHVTIDLSPLNKGNYIVKLSQNNNFTVEKLIIE
jgi:hypothetical protein